VVGGNLGGQPVIDVAWGSATDRGRVRAVNEDALLAQPPLFVVADGMGGHAAGDIASQLAVDGLSELLERVSLGVSDVIDAIEGVNDSILLHAADRKNLAGMGTTIAGVAMVAVGGIDHWVAFNLGDSRVYRLLDGELTQLTVDHSEAQELVAAGRLTEDEARSYRRRNVVTRSLGIDPPDTVDTWVFPPTPGERFLLCSDGLTGEVEIEQIRVLLAEVTDPQSAADALVRSAIEAGGADNVTVVVVDHLSSGSEDVNGDTAPRRIHAC
jgi:serine/threonine protein phosphatase PrpC